MSTSIQPARENYFEYIYNFLSKPFFGVAKRTSLSANSITLISGLFGFWGCYFLYSGASVLGFILIQLYAVLDLVDGDIARYQQRSSPFGGALDTLIDKFIEFLLFFVLFCAFWDESDTISMLVIMSSYFFFSSAQFNMVYNKLGAGEIAKKKQTKKDELETKPKRLLIRKILKPIFINLLVGHSTIVFVIPFLFLIDQLYYGINIFFVLLCYTYLVTVYITLRRTMK